MILFQTEEQDIIYTGDFRVSKKDIENIKIFRGLKNVIVYTDSTFMKKSYMHFPSQSESVKVIIEEIQKFLKGSSSSKGNVLFI
jgi:Cft2 family RNA processing exonuclease